MSLFIFSPRSMKYISLKKRIPSHLLSECKYSYHTVYLIKYIYKSADKIEHLIKTQGNKDYEYFR